MTGNCKHTTYKNGDDWGMVYETVLPTWCTKAMLFLRQQNTIVRWGFPKIVGPPVIIHLNRFSTLNYKPSISGYPHLWKPPLMFVYLEISVGCRSNTLPQYMFLTQAEDWINWVFHYGVVAVEYWGFQKLGKVPKRVFPGILSPCW